MTQPLVLREGNTWSQRRIALGLSMRHLEELSGVSRGTISRIEQGRYIPTTSEAERLLTALQKAEAEAVA